MKIKVTKFTLSDLRMALMAENEAEEFQLAALRDKLFDEAADSVRADHDSYTAKAVCFTVQQKSEG